MEWPQSLLPIRLAKMAKLLLVYNMDLASLTETLAEVHLMQPTASVILAAVLAALLLILSGFASGSEIAFFSLSPTDLNELDPEKSSADRNIQMLRADSERTLATILIANNFVNVTIIMLCNFVFSRLVNFGHAYWLQFVCITVLLTLWRNHAQNLQPSESVAFLPSLCGWCAVHAKVVLAARKHFDAQWLVGRESGAEGEPRAQR